MTFIRVSCWSCPAQFTTLSEMSTHHLDAHARPDPPLPDAPLADVAPELTPSVNGNEAVAREMK
jgi:hypothetical protein